MLDLLFIPAAILYLLVVCMLFIYGLNFLYLTQLTIRKQNQRLEPPHMDAYPFVTVQLPIYNEMYVARRLIEAAAQLDYPRHLLEIQVLDDSTDETVNIIQDLIECLRAQGVNIILLHRENRTGFKAGALAAGFACSKGEFLAIFDADFLPPADFLKRTVPYFKDPQVGFVQTRWGHINRDYSVLTRLQSLAIDAHFTVEQFARSQGGFWFNFNGTAGIWRRATLESAGGWKADTLTEDLDLSYRSFLSGWRAIYLREVEVPSELPVSFSAYRKQQYRWARGSLECAYKYLPRIWHMPMAISKKIEATLHLTGYFVHLLLFALAILYPLALLLAYRYANLTSLFGFFIFFNSAALAPTILFLVAQQQLGNRWWSHLPVVLFISAFGAGMMINTLRAALHAFLGRNSVFERTPKFGILRKNQSWVQKRYQLNLDPLVFPEIAFALLNLATVILAIQQRNLFIAIYAAIFCIGLLFTSGLTIVQTAAVFWHRARRVNVPIE